MYSAVSGSTRVAIPRSASQAAKTGTTRAACSLRGLEMMPTVLILAAGMKEKLPIAFSSQDRAGDDATVEPLGLDGGAHTIAGGQMQLRIAHDAALADLAAPDFELGLHQDHQFSARGEQRHDGRDQQRGGNEAGVAHGQVEPHWKILGSKISRVHAFADHHAWVVAQLPIELAVANVDRPHARCAALEQAIGEAAGGGADVETNAALDVDGPMIESRRQLVTAAADEGHALKQLDLSIAGHAVAGLFGFLAVEEHVPGENQSLRLFARIGQTAINQDLIETCLGR